MTKYQIEAFGKVTTYATLEDAHAAAEAIYVEHNAIAAITFFDFTPVGTPIDHVATADKIAAARAAAETPFDHLTPIRTIAAARAAVENIPHT